jgi:hypothetical protein
MPSINVAVNFFSHRKTMRLISQLGDRAVAGLLRLWCYAAQHFPDTGELSDMNDAELEYVMQWTGVQGELIKTLIGVGFLDVVDSTCHIHDWKDHAGHLAIYRERAKKGAVARHMKNVVSNTTPTVITSASSMLQANSHIIKSTTSASSMLQASLETNKHGLNAFQCNALQCNTKDREESACPVSAKPSRPPVLPDDEWLKALKLNPIYTGIDIDLQLRKASAWYPAHGKKLTRRAFIKWLIKEMDIKPMQLKSKPKPFI